MIIGYSQVPAAADADSINRLCKGLSDAGAHVVFIDQPHDDVAAMHGSAADRPQLDAALAMASRGDVLLAFTPLHLARSATDLVQIGDRLAAQGASLKILRVAGRQQLDTGTPSGAVMLATIGVLAAFNPNTSLFDPGTMPSLGILPMMHGADELPSLRRPRGRPPTASNMTPEINEMRASGMGATEIARRLRICRSSVYRILQTGGATAETVDVTRPAASPVVVWKRPAPHSAHGLVAAE